MAASARRLFHPVMEPPRAPDADALRSELAQLVASWEYAFAMGHGCSLGDHPAHRAVRRRAADLRALIGEHSA